MANTPKPIRKAGKQAAAATREELGKKPKGFLGSPLQRKSGESFMKTYKSDTKNYVGKKAVEPVVKADKKSGPKSSPVARKKKK